MVTLSPNKSNEVLSSVHSIHFISNGSLAIRVNAALTVRINPFGPIIIKGSVLSAFDKVANKPGRPRV